MSKKTCAKTATVTAAGIALASTLAMGGAGATENPFGMTRLADGYMVAGKDGEGKCGGMMEKQMKDAEGKCGNMDKGAKSDKKGEGKCGNMDKAAKPDKKGEGKCGEGKCGGMKK